MKYLPGLALAWPLLGCAHLPSAYEEVPHTPCRVEASQAASERVSRCRHVSPDIWAKSPVAPAEAAQEAPVGEMPVEPWWAAWLERILLLLVGGGAVKWGPQALAKARGQKTPTKD